MVKQVRIPPGGKIVSADAKVHTIKDPAKGGPDQVQWVRTMGNNDTYTIRFKTSPFQGGSQDIPIPPSNLFTVTQDPGEYKYEVLDVNGNVVDDPHVVID